MLLDGVEPVSQSLGTLVSIKALHDGLGAKHDDVAVYCGAGIVVTVVEGCGKIACHKVGSLGATHAAACRRSDKVPAVHLHLAVFYADMVLAVLCELLGVVVTAGGRSLMGGRSRLP